MMGAEFYCLTALLVWSKIGSCDEERTALIDAIANEENQ